MNSLHQVVDEIEGRRIKISDGIKSGIENEIARFASGAAARAVCFNAGLASEICDRFSLIREICILPYPVCWIEFQAIVASSGETVQSAILLQQSEEEIDWVTFFKTPGVGWGVVDAGIDSPWNLDNGDTNHVNLNDRNAKISDTIRGWAQLFLCAINCSNVQTVEERPPEKLNAARRRRGKQPLFSTWTLQIKNAGNSSTQSDCGESSRGTVRVHLVRGHIRKHHWQPGNFIWVNAHARGNPSAGMVHKDYEFVSA